MSNTVILIPVNAGGRIVYLPYATTDIPGVIKIDSDQFTMTDGVLSLSDAYLAEVSDDLGLKIDKESIITVGLNSESLDSEVVSAAYIYSLLAEKVNKVTGYDLSQNDFTDAYKSKLDGIEVGATADQTASEIKSLYESNADTNAFTDSDEAKLDGIEADADVNIIENVNISGTDIPVVDKRVTLTTYIQTLINTAINNLVDSSPGTLDTLNELAAALGDDPNFAATIATSLGTKLGEIATGTNIDQFDTSGIYLLKKGYTYTIDGSSETPSYDTFLVVTKYGSVLLQQRIDYIGNDSNDSKGYTAERGRYATGGTGSWSWQSDFLPTNYIEAGDGLNLERDDGSTGTHQKKTTLSVSVDGTTLQINGSGELEIINPLPDLPTENPENKFFSGDGTFKEIIQNLRIVTLTELDNMYNDSDVGTYLINLTGSEGQNITTFVKIYKSPYFGETTPTIIQCIENVSISGTLVRSTVKSNMYRRYVSDSFDTWTSADTILSGASGGISFDSNFVNSYGESIYAINVLADLDQFSFPFKKLTLKHPMTQNEKDVISLTEKTILQPCDLNDLKGTAVNPDQIGGTNYTKTYTLMLTNMLNDAYFDYYKNIPEKYEIPQQIFGGIYELLLSYVPALNLTYQTLTKTSTNETDYSYNTHENIKALSISRTYNHTTEEWTSWETTRAYQIGVNNGELRQVVDNSYIQKLPISVANTGKGYYMDKNHELVSTGTPYTGVLFRLDYIDYPGYFIEIYVVDDGTNVTLKDDVDFELYNSTDGWLHSNVYTGYNLEVTSVDTSSYPNASTIIGYFSIGEIVTDKDIKDFYAESFVNATLLSSGWSGGTQTISVSGVLGDSSQEIIAYASLPTTNQDYFTDADIRLTAEASGTLTFTHIGDEPTTDIDIRISIKGGA